ncbi:beta-lactamase/transpeptidase-like protein [Scenedesmus sp. NREL 46B-D3]|nr:beta-lactamase/transpeptidase-like protein [Scenedesmus sp. NREL 46B-D3]
MNLQASGETAALPLPIKEFQQAVEAHPLLHISFPGTNCRVLRDDDDQPGSCRLLFELPAPEWRLEGCMQALVAATAVGDAAAAEQQRAQALADWAASHPQAPIELSAEVAALQPEHMALQGAYVMAGTRERGLLVEGGTPGADRSMAVPLRSMSKSLVAITVLLLQQRGLLSLDAHLGQYLPCFDTAELRARQGLTLRSVLCHTSGLASDVSVSAMRDATLSLQQAAALLAAAELEDEPGAAFKYSNTAMQVAGAAVEAVSGHTWHEVFADEVAAPLGLTGTHWINTNSEQQRPANPHMSVGCISSPGDLCAVICMLANGGRLPSSSSSSSSGGGGGGVVLLQPELFEELVRLQSAGDPQDLSWAFACVHNGQPIPALQHLQEAGLLQPKDVQFAADLWGQPGYGLGIWRARSRATGKLHIALRGVYGAYAAIHDLESDDPQWVVWSCFGCSKPGWHLSGIMLTAAAERSWGSGAEEAAAAHSFAIPRSA